MSAARKAWIVGASIGAVEALKDQGFCRWTYTIRSLHQRAMNNMRSISQANKLSSSSSAMVSSKLRESRQSEESLRKVMYLRCWGPNSMSWEVCHENLMVNAGWIWSTEKNIAKTMIMVCERKLEELDEWLMQSVVVYKKIRC